MKVRENLGGKDAQGEECGEREAQPMPYQDGELSPGTPGLQLLGSTWDTALHTPSPASVRRGNLYKGKTEQPHLTKRIDKKH